MTGCSQCSSATREVDADGLLCLVPTLPHALPILRAALEGAQIAFTQATFPGILITLTPGLLLDLANQLVATLSPNDLLETRAIVVRDEQSVSLADMASVLPLGTLLGRIRGGWFTDMVRENRFTSHFQPIVSAVEPTKVFAHECLLRGLSSDGSVVPPTLVYEAARAADMIFPLDRAARLTAIRCAVEHGLDRTDECLFINFNPTSIYDPVFCLRSTVSAIEKSAYRNTQIVFEIVESDECHDVNHLLKIASYYRNAGFRIALDDLGAGYGSINLLNELRPEFVKFDMKLIRDVDRDPYKAGILRNLLNMTKLLGITTVAEGIETQGEWEWSRDNGADFVQGYYFARPAGTPYRPAAVSKTGTVNEPHFHQLEKKQCSRSS